MTALERLYNAAVVPVVVLDDAADAVPTAKALLAGGVDVMEITFRTAAAADSIEAVAKECPDMLVGAGTVITLEQCKNAVARGIKAGQLVKEVSAICGGSGGGKPDSAMGGGKDPMKLDNALAIVDEFVAANVK